MSIERQIELFNLYLSPILELLESIVDERLEEMWNSPETDRWDCYRRDYDSDYTAKLRFFSERREYVISDINEELIKLLKEKLNGQNSA